MRIKLDRQKILRLLHGFAVQVPTEVGMLEFEAEQHEWMPLRQIPMSAHVQAMHTRIDMDPGDMEVWANETYEVFVKPQPAEDGKPHGTRGFCHMSVKRYDRMAVHNWRHLQQMKNEIFGEGREAIELYPSEGRVADNANQTHLWVFPEGEVLPIGFEGGFALTDEQTEAYNANGDKGYQEPNQPGLTTGDKMREAIAQGMTDPEQKELFERVIRGELA